MSTEVKKFIHLNTIKTPEELDEAEHEIIVHVSKFGWDIKLQLRWKKLKRLRAKFQG